MESRTRLSGDSGWSQLNTALAAALGTLGVPIRSSKQANVVTRSSREIIEDTRVTFHLGTVIRGHGSDVSTPKLLRRLRSGAVERDEPDHPILDALAGIQNRAQYLRWIKGGLHQRCAVCPGTGRFRVIDGPEMESMKRLHPAQLCGTKDLKIVAALGRVGIPLVRWEGPEDHRIFYVAIKGHAIHGLQYDATDLVHRLKTGDLAKTEPLHPFLIAFEALGNLNRLYDHINREGELLMIRAPGTTRYAFIRTDATGAAHDAGGYFLKNGEVKPKN